MGVVFFVKKWKMGCCCKKWTFPRRRVHNGQYQYFLFYIMLIWGGCVLAQRTPLPTGLLLFADAPNRAGMDDKLLSLSGYFGLGPGLRLEAIIRNLLRSS